jgi:hypothetical protein
MVDKTLLENVTKLGVPMMVPEEDVDVHKTLADVVKSHDTRLWESYPVLLSSALKKYSVDFAKVHNQLHVPLDQDAFVKLTALSKAMYDAYHQPWAELQKSLEPFRKFKSDVEDALKPLRDAVALAQQHVSVANVPLSTERLKRLFEDYLGRLSLEHKKELAKHQELSLEYALSQVFSPKQKELFYKKLKGEVLTKTEREYFSRTVKRKVLALANDELHVLARKLLA